MFLPRVPYGQVKALVLVVTFLAMTLVSLMYRMYKQPAPYEFTEGRTSPWHEWNKTAPRIQSEEVQYLKYLVQTYGLTKDVRWHSRRMRSTYSASKRLSMTDTTLRFMPAGDSIRINVDDENLDLSSEQPVNLVLHRSARPDELDASAFLFGISSTYSRLIYANHSLIRDWQRWLTDGKGTSNGAQVLLALHDASKTEIDKITRILQSAGIDAAVTSSKPSLDTASRYMDLLQSLMQNQDKGEKRSSMQRKFLSLIDDDTFFPSMDKLLRELAKFKNDEPYYIGVPSERSDWFVERNESMTYGGGAVFVTQAMAEMAASCFRKDKRDNEFGSGSAWDAVLYDCISKNTEENLHILPSFYSPEDDQRYGQETISNEGYGGGIQPLTLHHARNWHRFEAGKGHLVTSVCGEDCFLQRFQFKDDWILVNGYSITNFPDGMDAIPLKKGSKLLTQDSRDAKPIKIHESIVLDSTERLAETADMKMIVWTGRKRVWRLADSKLLDNGEVWQAYIKRKDGGNWDDYVDRRLSGDRIHSDEERTDRDSVIVLIWEP